MSPPRTTAADSFGEIATVRIELADTDPPIWRQVEVPTSITLKVLHDIVQATIGWFDYHLWEFTIGEQKYGLPMDEDWGTEPRKEAIKPFSQLRRFGHDRSVRARRRKFSEQVRREPAPCRSRCSGDLPGQLRYEPHSGGGGRSIDLWCRPDRFPGLGGLGPPA